MKENYVYPARMTSGEDKCKIEFLDFPNIEPVYDTKENIISSAQDWLGTVILEYESSDMELPNPSKSNESDVIYIPIWLPYYRMKTKEVYVKKTLTIPMSLDIRARENNINFSATLVKGIKDELEEIERKKKEE